MIQTTLKSLVGGPNLRRGVHIRCDTAMDKARGTYHSSVRREALGLLVLRFWLFLDRLFGNSVFGFAVHFGLRILRGLTFGFRFSRIAPKT